MGLRKNHVCSRNGKTYRTSRYLTLIAASQVPTPKATIAAAAIHIGKEQNLRSRRYVVDQEEDRL